MKQVQSQWNKGVNKRLSDRRGDPQRLSELINARLQQRGSTLEVSRIQGFEFITNISTSGSTFFDAVMYEDQFVVLWKGSVFGRITIADINTGATQTFNLSDLDVDYGKLTLLEDTIFITPYDRQLNYIDGQWRLNPFVSTTPVIENISVSSGGRLDQNEDYWYKVRYRYYDGHITTASFPKKVSTTTTNRTVELTITSTDDLDGELAEVEVYRKKGSQDFFLIDRSQPFTDPYVFTDDGKPILSPFEDENYVWATQSRSQEFVRDRIVRAGNQYDSNEDTSQFEVRSDGTTVSTGNQILPYNTDVEFFSRIRKEDGTTGFFKFHDTISTEGDDARIEYRQTHEHTGPVKEIAKYARFRPRQSADAVKFNSLEIYNSHVPSIATANEAEAEQDKPTNPHVFLGWKYILGIENPLTMRIHDEDWDTAPNENTYDDDYFPIGQNGYPDHPTMASIDKIDVTVTDGNQATSIGQALPYTRKYYRDDTSTSDRNSAIFQLAWFDAIREAIRQGILRVKLTATNEVSGLSTEAPDGEFIDLEVKVVGIEDKSATEQNVYYDDSTQIIYPSGTNRLYLVLENGTPFDDFNNQVANNSDVRANYDAAEVPDVSHRYEFELIGLQEIDVGQSSANSLDDWDEYDYDYRLRLTDYADFENESAVLLDSTQTNESNGSFGIPPVQGWEKTVNNKFEFASFNGWNVLESVIVKDDLRQFDDNYPNQLIWSQSFIPRSNASKVRNFEFTNFKNISADYGKIIDIQYVHNVLLVFCERGVNLTNVGEVLTQQAGGEVYVDTSRFLTSDYWILKSVPNIQAKSIKQYENMLFFSDGRDIWKYEQGLENISNGAIDIGSVNETQVGSIDPLNKEYRIATPNGTWVYSIEFGEWMGPHTYKDSISTTYRDRIFSVVSNNLVEHNKGYKFNTLDYNTIIAGVANSADDPTATKLFRKFYVETQPTDAQATFEYGKDEDINKSLQLSTNKNDLYHVGIDNKNKNGRYLSWKVITNEDGFILSSIGLLFEPKKRR